MPTNFAAEFSKIFSTTGCTIEGYDWKENHYFDPSSDCYAAEAALVSELTSEAYSKFGFEVEYYVKQISTKRDQLQGEDQLENFVRRFKLNVYTESVPQMERHYELQGMHYTDIVHLQCTIQHFKEASVLSYLTNQAEYEEYYPKIGDVMYFPWNKMFYELVNVKTFSDQSSFLGTPITFEFILREWHPSHEDVDIMQQNPDNMDTVRQFAELAETFDIETSVAKDVAADKVDEQKNLPFSTDGDVLSINNSLNGLDKRNKIKSINEPIYRNELDESVIFDPFEN